MNEMLTNLVNMGIKFKKEDFITDELGRQHMIGGYNEVKPNLIPGFKSHSLQSIVDYIKQTPDSYKEGFIIHVADHETVFLYSATFGKWEQRHKFLSVNAQYPEFRFGAYHDQEEFIVGLLSKFCEDEGRDYALNIASGIVENDDVKIVDNGMSQKVSLNKGVGSLLESEKVVPFVNLTPYRTFVEIKQPDSIFLLRLRRGGQVALFEADGGKWKLDVIESIVKYFKDHLDGIDFSILY